MELISVYQIKGRFQEWLRPLVGLFAKIGVTPNQVTFVATLLSALGGAGIATFPDDRWPWLLLPIILFVRMALNAIDGMLAREHRMQTRLGVALNELGDVISDTFLYLPFMLVAGAFAWLVALVCVLSVISELAGLIGIQIGFGRRHDGPMGKSDRALVFGVLGIFIGIGLTPGLWLVIAFAIMLALLVITIVNRTAKALKEERRDA